jgi:hypothetical protein
MRSKNKMNYPKSNEEWRKAIHHALGISPQEGRKLADNNAVPVEKILKWIEQEYLAPCGKNFIEAINRNRKGFISWIYGNRAEPYWPGKDIE